MRREAPEALATERLRGERAREEHRALFRRVAASPLAMATLGGLRTPAEIDAMFDRHLHEWDDAGFGTWMWFERASGRHLGHAQLTRYERLGAGCIELGYAFHPDAWGQGFAAEAAARVVAVALDDLRAEVLVAQTLPSNEGSRRVIERCGLRYACDVEHAGRTHVLYRLDLPRRAARTRG